ncbi:unnamed protein product [Ixodes pacificus]
MSRNKGFELSERSKSAPRSSPSQCPASPSIARGTATATRAASGWPSAAARAAAPTIRWLCPSVAWTASPTPVAASFASTRAGSRSDCGRRRSGPARSSRFSTHPGATCVDTPLDFSFEAPCRASLKT